MGDKLPKRGKWVWWSVSAAVFVLVVALVVIGAVWRHAQQISVLPPPEVSQPLSPVHATKGSSDDTKLRSDVSAVMDKLSSDPRFGQLHAIVANANTGAELWQKAADTPAVPASTMKILTSAAALIQLGPDHTVKTKVARVGQTNDIVLIGGGDPTLSASRKGFYTDAAQLSDLADQVKSAMPGGVGRVFLDNHLFPESFHPTWDKAGLVDGYIAPVESVAIEAGRFDPTNNDSARSEHPAQDATKALADAVGGKPAEVDAPLPAVDSTEIASVTSAPLDTRIRDLMQNSDNVLAESVAREVAISRGQEPTFSGAAKAVRDTLVEHGFNLGTGGSAAQLVDSSGLSPDNRLSPRVLDGVLQQIVGEGSPGLAPMLDSFPVANVSGTLSSRYAANPGAGLVRAKTGTLDGTSALAGYVVTKSGQVLTFAFLSNDASLLPARAVADQAAGELSRL